MNLDAYIKANGGMKMTSILTKREKEIFNLLKQNYTTSQIALELDISEKTVRNHISNVMNKLGAASRVYAMLELVKMKEIEL